MASRCEAGERSTCPAGGTWRPRMTSSSVSDGVAESAGRAGAGIPDRAGAPVRQRRSAGG